MGGLHYTGHQRSRALQQYAGGGEPSRLDIKDIFYRRQTRGGGDALIVQLSVGLPENCLKTALLLVPLRMSEAALESNINIFTA